MNENKTIKSSGSLYIVATPIGNLEDITLRALRILKEVDFIFCEDTRVTQKLLNKYQIKTKLTTLHKFNEKSQITKIISLLEGGNNIALVSDAGTPVISDPGNELISAASCNKIKIIPIPGASALISALSACPINFKSFNYVGFLPDKTPEREKIISLFGTSNSLMVLYIAPHDFKKYLKEIHSKYQELEIFYAREITKIYEECWHGKINELIKLLEQKELKGEIVLILNFQGQEKKTHKTEKELISQIKKNIESGKSLKEASKNLAKEFDIPSRTLYEMYIKKK